VLNGKQRNAVVQTTSKENRNGYLISFQEASSTPAAEAGTEATGAPSEHTAASTEAAGTEAHDDHAAHAAHHDDAADEVVVIAIPSDAFGHQACGSSDDAISRDALVGRQACEPSAIVCDATTTDNDNDGKGRDLASDSDDSGATGNCGDTDDSGEGRNATTTDNDDGGCHLASADSGATDNSGDTDDRGGGRNATTTDNDGGGINRGYTGSGRSASGSGARGRAVASAYSCQSSY
jgi:hypothetical protein